MNSEENFELNIKEEIKQEILYNAIKDEIDKKNRLKASNNYSSKNKKRIRILKKDIQIKSILILIITLIVNTYAWFLYISTVSASLTMHIRDWKFEMIDGSASNDFTFAIGEIYPGVPKEDTVQEIITKNSSTTTVAELTCKINSVKIFDDEYKVGDTYDLGGGLTGTYTSEDLLRKITTEYPFKIRILLVTKDALGVEREFDYDPTEEHDVNPGDEVTIRIRVEWDYQLNTTDEDELKAADIEDTNWGTLSYEFSHNPANAGKDSIVIQMDVTAVQKEGT